MPHIKHVFALLFKGSIMSVIFVTFYWLGLVGSGFCSPHPAPGPAILGDNMQSFTEDPYVTDEKFREKVASRQVLGVVGGRAEIPCDLTAPFPSDEPHIILFYKDAFGTPIYSFDMRVSEDGRHWRDNGTLGNRAFFQFRETGTRSETGAKVIASFLVIEPLFYSDKGTYRCRVDFKEAPTKNTRIHLSLIAPSGPPVIRSESGKTLIDFTEPVTEGGSLTMVCETIGGDPLPRVSWWRGNRLIDDIVDEVDAKAVRVRNSVRILNLQRKDQGERLTCKSSNTNLTEPIETFIAINMVFPPIRAKIVREWSFFSAGQAYNVSCQVLGSRPPAVTSIFVGPSQLREVNYQVSPDGNVSTTTVIFIPDDDDQDKFITCRAENLQVPSSSVEDQWRITVHYTPRVSLQIVNTLDKSLIRAGDTVYLRCIAKANPLVHTISWFYQESALDLKNSGGNILITDDSLILRHVNEHQQGTYRCVAKNQVGAGSSNAIDLTVKSVPFCTNGEQMKVVRAARHERIELDCSMDAGTHGIDKASGKPKLEFRWSLNTSKDQVDIQNAQFTVDGTTSHLNYIAKTDLDYGTMTCLASNEVGESNKACVFQIVRDGKPKGLKNCTAVNQTFESLSIICLAGEALVQDQRFILEVFESHSSTMVVNITTNKPVFHIRGLSAGTEYYVEIYSVNSNGISEHTIFETFTLQPAEKQLAATTTDLTSNNPMRLLPIMAVLIAIVLLLVIIAVVIIIVMRGRRRPGLLEDVSKSRSSSFEQTKSIESQSGDPDFGAPTKLLKDSPHGQQTHSPDLIPERGFAETDQNAMMYDKMKLMGNRPKPIIKNANLQLTDCQYAELVFDGRCQTLSVDDSVMYRTGGMSTTSAGIHYATIDHHPNRKNRSPVNYCIGSGNVQHSSNRRRSKDGPTTASTGSGPGSSATLPHSSRCPYKDDHSRHGPLETGTLKSSRPPSRSGTLKRVAFKDEEEGPSPRGIRRSRDGLDEVGTMPPPPARSSMKLYDQCFHCIYTEYVEGRGIINTLCSQRRTHSSIVGILGPSDISERECSFPTPPPPPGYDNCDDDEDVAETATTKTSNFNDTLKTSHYDETPAAQQKMSSLDDPSKSLIPVGGKSRRHPPPPPARSTPPVPPPKPSSVTVNSVLECNSLKRNGTSNSKSPAPDHKGEPCSPVKDVESTL